MITARKIRKAIDNLSIIFGNRERTFGDLEEDKNYVALVRSIDEYGGDTLLRGSKREILESLLKLHLADREALKILGYQIKVYSDRER